MAKDQEKTLSEKREKILAKEGRDKKGMVPYILLGVTVAGLGAFLFLKSAKEEVQEYRPLTVAQESTAPVQETVSWPELPSQRPKEEPQIEKPEAESPPPKKEPTKTPPPIKETVKEEVVDLPKEQKPALPEEETKSPPPVEEIEKAEVVIQKQEQKPSPPKEEEIRIPLSEVSDGKAHYYSIEDQGTEIKFFVLKSRDGVVRAAFDACDVCFKHRKGYRQEGDNMVCNNCGMKFESNKINLVSGGCNPAPLDRKIEGDEVVISPSAVKQGAWYFGGAR